MKTIVLILVMVLAGCDRLKVPVGPEHFKIPVFGPITSASQIIVSQGN